MIRSKMRIATAIAGGLLMAGVTTGCPKQPEVNMAPVEAAANKTEAAANRAEKAAASAADSAKRADAAAQAVEAMRAHPIGHKGKKATKK